ncbi:unnamed protein product [Schistosoma turkestanicum]|nr:unnamed protein product [Schistosoma turkestanicum]
MVSASKHEKRRIQAYLVSLCEELKRRLEHDKKSIELTPSGDILEFKPSITRKLRRRAIGGVSGGGVGSGVSLGPPGGGNDLSASSNPANFMYWGDLLLCGGSRWSTMLNSNLSTNLQKSNSADLNNNPPPINVNTKDDEENTDPNQSQSSNLENESKDNDRVVISHSNKMPPVIPSITSSSSSTVATSSVATATTTSTFNSTSKVNIFGSLGLNPLDGSLLSHLLASINNNNTTNNNTLASTTNFYTNSAYFSSTTLSNEFLTNGGVVLGNASCGSTAAVAAGLIIPSNGTGTVHLSSSMKLSPVAALNCGLVPLLSSSVAAAAAAAAAAGAINTTINMNNNNNHNNNTNNIIINHPHHLHHHSSLSSTSTSTSSSMRKRRHQNITPSAQLNLLLPEHEIYADLTIIHRACSKIATIPNGTSMNIGSRKHTSNNTSNSTSNTSNPSQFHCNSPVLSPSLGKCYEENYNLNRLTKDSNTTTTTAMMNNASSSSATTLDSPNSSFITSSNFGGDLSTSTTTTTTRSGTRTTAGIHSIMNNSNSNSNATPTFSVWIDDGRLYCGNKCYQIGASIILEGRDGSSHRCTGTIASIGVQDLAIRRCSDHGICRVTVQQLKQGRYTIWPNKLE